MNRELDISNSRGDLQAGHGRDQGEQGGGLAGKVLVDISLWVLVWEAATSHEHSPLSFCY